MAIHGAVLACSCAQPSAEQGYDRATAVFAGTVSKIEEPFWARLGLSTPGAHDVTFQVRKRWKGADAATATVRTRLSGEACGYPFQLGGAYLVFVAPGPAEDLETGICSGTRDLAGAEEAIGVLDGLAEREPPVQ